MPSLHALVVGAGLLAISLVIMTARSVSWWRRIIAALVLALITSGASAVYATSRHAGTADVISRGFPRPFHSTPGGINALFFGANTVVHFGVLSLIAAVAPRIRGREWDTNTMHPHMLVVIRIVLGVFFLILAAIGGLVPILQGWIFFLLAILVLFPKAKFTEKILHKAERKLPRIVRFLRKVGIGQTTNAGTVRTE